MNHLLLERLALQREDVLKSRARDQRPSATEAAEPRMRRTTTQRLVRVPAW
jgi:hypothetical protein